MRRITKDGTKTKSNKEENDARRSSEDSTRAKQLNTARILDALNASHAFSTFVQSAKCCGSFPQHTS